MISQQPREQRIFAALCLLFLVYSIASRVWVTEDAYITFRSVENLYRGLGLVYNPGENIESFTHPLWMMCLVLLKGAGLPLHSGAIVIGLLCSGCALALLARPALSAGRLPLAALALAGISGFRDFATAGMEYSLLFVLLALFLRNAYRGRLLDHPLQNAVLLGLIYLCRPELALLGLYYSGFAAVEALQRDWQGRWQLRLTPAIFWAAGLLLTVAPYHLFRFLYYHDLFPNTYYAKSGLQPYYRQGLQYLYATLSGAPILWLLGPAAFLPTLWHRWRRELGPQRSLANLREAGAAALSAWYIVRVGGDFMAYRFFLPQIFILSVLAERWLQATPAIAPLQSLRNWLEGMLAQRTTAALRWAGLLALTALSLWPQPLTRGGIADERRYFFEASGASPLSLFFGQRHAWGLTGDRYRRLAECLDLRPLHIANSQAQAHCLRGIGLGYSGVAAGPRVYILDEQALPNRDVALSPVLVRWRPGHEHYLDREHVLRRGMLFCSSGEPHYDRAMRTDLGIVLSLDPEILARLDRPVQRLQQLLLLKQEGSSIVKRLELRYGQTIEQLLPLAARWEQDPFLERYRSCWQDARGSDALFFY
ncbi:MAG: hypothetical protein K1X75_13010 [Leptospirales bacterium]|nr:hypothetical protein [Leptospirales bacterium]